MRKRGKKLVLRRETLAGLERHVSGGGIVIRFTKWPCTAPPTTTNTTTDTTQPTTFTGSTASECTDPT